MRALLASVAAHGQRCCRREAAYAAGITAPGWRDPAPCRRSPLAAARDLRSLDAELLALGAVKPSDKLRMLEAVIAKIRADRRIEIDEHELFRAIAAALDCPLPPGFSA